MLFRPNTTCLLRRRGATANVYGKYTFSAGVTVPCAVVTYDLATQKSSVRADSSGSRGRALELAGIARFLFPTTVQVQRGDLIFKDNVWLEVIEIHPRRGVDGRHDHNEVDMKTAEPAP